MGTKSSSYRLKEFLAFGLLSHISEKMPTKLRWRGENLLLKDICLLIQQEKQIFKLLSWILHFNANSNWYKNVLNMSRTATTGARCWSERCAVVILTVSYGVATSNRQGDPAAPALRTASCFPREQAIDEKGVRCRGKTPTRASAQQQQHKSQKYYLDPFASS